MDIKQIIGEISGSNLINSGDKIRVKYYDEHEGNKIKTEEGMETTAIETEPEITIEEALEALVK